MRDADVGPRKGARAALFGSQAPSVAHFPLSFAFSLKSFFFFFKDSSQMLCHENYNFKGASEEMVGIGCGPSRLVASLGSLSKPLSCPRQLDSWIETDKSHEAVFVEASLVPGSTLRKHHSAREQGGGRYPL